MDGPAVLLQRLCDELHDIEVGVFAGFEALFHRRQRGGGERIEVAVPQLEQVGGRPRFGERPPVQADRIVRPHRAVRVAPLPELDDNRRARDADEAGAA